MLPHWRFLQNFVKLSKDQFFCFLGGWGVGVGGGGVGGGGWGVGETLDKFHFGGFILLNICLMMDHIDILNPIFIEHLIHLW